MVDSNVLMLICNDGRFIPIPAGVFLHPGPMSEPVDTAALLRARSVPRSPQETGTTTVVMAEQVLRDPTVIATVRKTLRHMPAAVRDRLILRTVPDARTVAADPAALGDWLKAADLLGLPRHGTYDASLPMSPRMVAVDARGRENPDRPVAVWGLPRGLAAARETVRAAVGLTSDPARGPWDRLTTLLAEASRIRDELLVPPYAPGDVVWGAMYPLAVGLALFGPSIGADLPALARGVLPVDVPELVRRWGGPDPAQRIEPEALTAALLRTPGSAALVLRPTGAARWLVSHDGRLWWADAQVDGEGALRAIDLTAGAGQLAELRSRDVTVLMVDPAGRRTTVDGLGSAAPASAGTSTAAPRRQAVGDAEPGAARRTETQPRPPAADLVAELGLPSGEPVFLVSTALRGGLAARTGPAIPASVLAAFVDGLRGQHPDARVLLVGPEPGGDLRQRSPELFALRDAASARGVDLAAQDDLDALLERLRGESDTTVIGAVDEVTRVSTELGIRSVRFGTDVPYDAPVGPEPGRLQRLDVPLDWPAHRGAVALAVRSLQRGLAAGQVADVERTQLRQALADWADSVRAYRAGLETVSAIGAYRAEFADRLAAGLAEGQAALSAPDPAGFRSWWQRFHHDPELELSAILRVFTGDVDELLRRAVDLTREYGREVWPKGVKALERDVFGTSGDPQLLPPQTPARPDGTPARYNPLFMPQDPERADELLKRAEQAGGGDVRNANVDVRGRPMDVPVRLNPLLMRMSDFQPYMLEDQPDGEWHYLVTPGGEIWIGSEQLVSLVRRGQLEALRAGWSQAYPGLTYEDVVQALDAQGHPTVSAGQREPGGPMTASPGLVSGEIHYDPATGGAQINDKSGRYMSKAVRPTQPGDDPVHWLTNVARRLGRQLNMPVRVGTLKQVLKDLETGERVETAPPPPRPVRELVPNGLGGFLADGAELIIRRSSVSGRPVLALLSPEDWHRVSPGVQDPESSATWQRGSTGRNWLPPGDLPAVVVHGAGGAGGFVRVPVRRDQQTFEVLLTVEQLAMVTADLPPDVALLACEVGEFDPAGVQGYATARDGTVLASRDDLIVPAEPIEPALRSEDGLGGQLITRARGSSAGEGGRAWMLFHPDGVGGGWDTLNDLTSTEVGRDVEFDGFRSVDPGGDGLRLGPPGIDAGRSTEAGRSVVPGRSTEAGRSVVAGPATGGRRPSAEPPPIREVTVSSEGRTTTRYQLSVGREQWTALVRVHLVAGTGTTAEQLREIRHDTVAGVEAAFNAPEHRLSRDAAGPVLRVGVEFVDSADQAHLVATVGGAVQDGAAMTLTDWLPGRSPLEYARQVAAQLGIEHLAADGPTRADLDRFVGVAQPFLGILDAWVAAAVREIRDVWPQAPAESDPPARDTRRREPTGTSRLARVESVVEARPGVVRFTHQGRSLDVRVEADTAYSTPALLLPHDSARDAVRGRTPEAVLRVPPGLAPDELAGWLLWAGTRFGVERGSRLSRFGQVLRYATPRDGFGPGTEARKRFSFGPGDLGRLASLAYRLGRMESLPAETPAEVIAALEAGVVRKLAALGVLRDQDGGPLRAEALWRWMRTAGLSTSSAKLVRELVLTARADTDQSNLVKAVATAAAVFAMSSPELHGTGLTAAGDLDVLRLRPASPPAGPASDPAAADPASDRAPAVDGEEIVEFQIKVVSGADWPRFQSVVLDDAPADDGRWMLEVRRDAGDAALRIGMAGTLAGWLAVRQGRSSDDVVVLARQRLAEHEALLDLRDGTATWLTRQLRKASRWARRTTGRTSFQIEIFDKMLAEVRAALRQLAEDPGLPADVAGELRAAAALRVSAAKPAAPVSDKPGVVVHAVRRVGASPMAILTTVGAGLVAGRPSHLIATSAVSQAAATMPQAMSDAANEAMKGSNEPPKDQLAKPDMHLDDEEFSRPAWSWSPMPNLTKRSPSGLAQSLAALFVLMAADQGGVTGGKALALTVAANLGAAELDHIFDYPEKVAAERYKYEQSRTYDKLRNDFAESAYYRIRELMNRVEASAQVSGEFRVEGVLRAELEQVRADVADMMSGITAEVGNLVGRMVERRRTPFRRSALEETYDLFTRGVVDGRPSHLHNAIRVGGQHASMQVPSFVLGFLAAAVVDLMTLNMAAAGGSGLVYGAGWSGLKQHEFRDLMAVASWDALNQLQYVDRAATYLLSEGRDPQVPRPVAIDEPADPSRYNMLIQLGWPRLAAALAQRRANIGAGRPAEVSGLLQILYKHLPSLAAHMVIAGAVSTALPLGPVVGAVVGIGGFAKLTTGLAENALRVSAPLFAQTARITSALAETRRLTLTKAELATEVRQLIARAKATQEAIKPVPTPLDQGVFGTVAAMPRSLARRLIGYGRATNRVSVRTGSVVHWQRPPALGRGPAPQNPVRLSVRDRRAVDRLHTWVQLLEHAYDPLRNARADLVPELVGKRVVLLLDSLGLRAEQDTAGHRWAAVVSELGSRHGYRRVGGGSLLAQLRGTRLADPDDPLSAADSDDPLSAALREAREADPLTARLWEAVNDPRLAGRVIDVRQDALVKVFPADAHRFALKVATAAPGADARAGLELAPDDLRHAINGTHRDETHRLTIHPDQASDPARLAEILDWAIQTWTTERGSARYRVHALLQQPGRTRFTLPALPGPPTDLRDDSGNRQPPVAPPPLTGRLAPRVHEPVAPPVTDPVAPPVAHPVAPSLPKSVTTPGRPGAAEVQVVLRAAVGARTPQGKTDPEAVDRVAALLPPVPSSDVPGLQTFTRNALGWPDAQLSPIAGQGLETGSGAMVYRAFDPAGTRTAIVKVFPTMTELVEELSALERLSGPEITGFRVPEVLAVGAGRLNGAPAGLLVESRAAGQTLDELIDIAGRVTTADRADHLARLGRAVEATGAAMAHLHASGAPGMAGTRVHDTYLAEQADWIRRQIARLPARTTSEPAAALAGRAEDAITRVKSEPGPAAMVHGDFHPGNVVWDPQTGTVTLIDLSRLHFSLDEEGRPIGMPQRDVSTFPAKLGVHGERLGLSPGEISALQDAFGTAYEAAGGARVEHVTQMYELGWKARRLAEAGDAEDVEPPSPELSPLPEVPPPAARGQRADRLLRPGVGAAAVPPDPVAVVNGIPRQVAHWARQGALTDEQYCVIAMAAAREIRFPGGLRSDRTRDDGDVTDVLWREWGRPETWPLMNDLAELHRLVEQRPGSSAFVVQAWPGRIGHAYVVLHHKGQARWIDPRHSGEGGLRLLPAGTWPARELLETGDRRDPRGAPTAREFDLRVRLYDGAGAPLPIPASVTAAPPPRDIDALVDRRLHYQGTGNEDEQRDFVVLLETPQGPMQPPGRKGQLARRQDGLFVLENERVPLYTGPGGRFYRSSEAARVAGGTGELRGVSVVERVSGVARSHVHEVTRPEPKLIYDAYAEMSRRSATVGPQDVTPMPTLFDGLGLDFSVLGEMARLARGPVGPPQGSRFHWTVGVVPAGLRRLLGHLLPRVWRDETRGAATRASLEDSLWSADRIAARYREWSRTRGGTPEQATPDDSTATAMISGHVGWLMHHAFAAAWAKAQGIPRGVPKQYLAFVARLQFADMLQSYPPAVRAFLAEHADVIWKEFRQWSNVRINFFLSRNDPRFELTDDTTIMTNSGLNTVPLRDFVLSGLREDVPAVNHRAFFGPITEVAGPDIAGGQLLTEHLVGEARGVGLEFMTEEDGWAFHQDLIKVSAEEYERTLVVPPALRYADGQAWAERAGTAPGVVDYLSSSPGPPPALLDGLHQVALAQRRPIVVVAASPQSGPAGTVSRQEVDDAAVDRLDNLLRERPELARQALFVVAGHHRRLHELRRRHRLSMLHPLVAPDDGHRGRDDAYRPGDGVQPAAPAPPLLLSDRHWQGLMVAGLGWRLVTFDNEVDDSLGPVLNPRLLTRALRRVDEVAELALRQGPDLAHGPGPGLAADYTAPDGTRYRSHPEQGRVPLPGTASEAITPVGAGSLAAAMRLLAQTLEGYRQAWGTQHLTTHLVLGKLDRLLDGASAHPDDRGILDATRFVAAVHHRTGDPDRAIALLGRVVAGYRRMLGDDDPATRQARAELAEVAAGRPTDQPAGPGEGSGQSTDVQVWVMSLPEVAPPSVAGVSAAVALFSARYRQWTMGVLEPRVAAADRAATEAKAALAGVTARLDELRASLGGLTEQSRQRVWDGFVQAAREYDLVRSRLAEDGSTNPAPPAVDELLRAAAPQATGVATERRPPRLSREAIPHDARTVSVTPAHGNRSVLDTARAVAPRRVTQWRIRGEQTAPATLEEFLGSYTLPRHLPRALSDAGLVLEAVGADRQLVIRAQRGPILYLAQPGGGGDDVADYTVDLEVRVTGGSGQPRVTALQEKVQFPARHLRVTSVQAAGSAAATLAGLPSLRPIDFPAEARRDGSVVLDDLDEISVARLRDLVEREVSDHDLPVGVRAELLDALSVPSLLLRDALPPPSLPPAQAERPPAGVQLDQALYDASVVGFTRTADGRRARVRASMLLHLRINTGAANGRPVELAFRLAGVAELLVDPVVLAQSREQFGLEPAPHTWQGRDGDRSWLIANGLATDEIARVLGAIGPDFDPRRLERLARDVGVEGTDGMRRLVRWAAVVERVPDDLPRYAQLIGIDPRPLFAVASELGVDPQRLLPVGDVLAGVAGTSTAATDNYRTWSAALVRRLNPIGVWTSSDLVLMLDLVPRLGLEAGDLPLFGELRRLGVSFELLDALPAESATKALQGARLRKSLMTGEQVDLASVAAHLGVSGPADVRTVADGLGMRPLDLALGLGDRVREIAARLPVEQVAAEMRRQLVADGLDTAQQQTRFVTLSARLGFPVSDLAMLLLPSDYGEWLLYEFVGDVPRDEVAALMTALTLRDPSDPGAAGSRVAAPRGPDAALRAQLPGPYSEAEIISVASQLDVNVAAVRAAVRSPMVNLTELLALVARSGLTGSAVKNLVTLVGATGRVPKDLTWSAYRLALESPAELVWAAGQFGADPRLLSPLRGSLDSSPGIPAQLSRAEKLVRRVVADYLVWRDWRRPWLDEHGSKLSGLRWALWLASRGGPGFGGEGVAPGSFNNHATLASQKFQHRLAASLRTADEDARSVEQWMRGIVTAILQQVDRMVDAGPLREVVRPVGHIVQAAAELRTAQLDLRATRAALEVLSHSKDVRDDVPDLADRVEQYADRIVTVAGHARSAATIAARVPGRTVPLDITAALGILATAEQRLRTYVDGYRGRSRLPADRFTNAGRFAGDLSTIEDLAMDALTAAATAAAVALHDQAADHEEPIRNLATELAVQVYELAASVDYLAAVGRRTPSHLGAVEAGEVLFGARAAPWATRSDGSPPDRPTEATGGHRTSAATAPAQGSSPQSPPPVPASPQPPPPAQASPETPGTAVDRVLSKIGGLPDWDGASDCADRVGLVLRGLGLRGTPRPAPGGRRSAVAEEGVRGRDAVAALFGGWFGPEGGVGRLAHLAVGALIPVWVRPLPSARPRHAPEPVNVAPHMVLVHRLSEERFVLFETQQAAPAPGGSDRRAVEFDLATLRAGGAALRGGGRLPPALQGNVRLVVDADGALRQYDMRSGQVIAGPGRSTPEDRLGQALVDPTPGPGEPGLIGEELEGMVRLGAGRPFNPPDQPYDFRWQGVKLARVVSLGLTLSSDAKLATRGRSGRWYPTPRHAGIAADPVDAMESWSIVEVIGAPGAVLPEEVGSVPYTAAQNHQINKAMMRWLQWAGSQRLTLGQAMRPGVEQTGHVIEAWWAQEQQSGGERAWAAQLIRQALLTPGDVEIYAAATEPLDFSHHFLPAHVYYQSTADVELAGLTTFLRADRQEAGTASAQTRNLGVLLDLVLGFARSVSASFLRSLSQGPLTDADVRELLQSEEALAMEGALATVLTHVLLLSYQDRYLFSHTKNAVLALSRHELTSYIAALPDDARNYIRDNADTIVESLVTFAEERDAGLADIAPPGGRWIDKEFESALGRPISVRQVLRHVFRQDWVLGTEHADIFGRVATLPLRPPPPGMNQTFAFERRHQVSRDDPTRPDAVEFLVTLDGTDAQFESTLRMTQDAREAARAAKEWSARWQGGVRAAAQFLSQAHGNLTPTQDPNVALDASGQLWRRHTVYGTYQGWWPIDPPAQQLDINRAAVTWSSPPLVPAPFAWFDGAGTLPERIGQLRDVLTEAAPQVMAVIAQDTDQARAARPVWRTATEGLARLATRAKMLDDDVARTEFTMLLFTIDQAVDQIIKLAPHLSNLFAGIATRQKPAHPTGPPAPAPRPPVEVRVLGEWAGSGAGKLLDQIREQAGGAGRPVVAVDLSGTSGMKAIQELDGALREYRSFGEAPVLLVTAGTRQAEEALAEIRARYQPVTIQQRTAGWDMVWELRAADGQPVRMAAAPERVLFETAGALPTPPVGAALPPVLLRWLKIRDWGEAEAYHRQHDAELRRPEIVAALRELVAAHPEIPRLSPFLTILEVAARAETFPTARLTPKATTVLELEPNYDPARNGPVPVTFVYDYLSARGTRKERFPMDGLLWQLMLAGEFTHAQALTLVRAAAVTRTDKAHATVFEALTELLQLDDAVVVEDPKENDEIRAILSKVGRVTASRGPASGKNPDCVDPVDRAALVPRLDDLKKRLGSSGAAAGQARAALTETFAYLLSNC
ncbi:hypothetical protein ACN27G_19415 [Plantactinospora sp. WMMB334]|uniref:hypothetical protein n=1 Tax=Plantactinospora sp. WMMB334 TaxID=3404119 RepID=UPI003B9365C2